MATHFPFRGLVGWLAIALDRCHNVHIRRRSQKTLLEPREEIVYVIGFCFRSIPQILANRKGVVFFDGVGERSVAVCARQLEGRHFLLSFCKNWQCETHVAATALQWIHNGSSCCINTYNASAT
jgi:hypothetical protein